MEESDIVTIKPHYRRIIYNNAQKASLGGRSNVRGKDRSSNLLTDQIVGQLGTYALSMFLFGNPKKYLETRDLANTNPWSGDNGYDLIGVRADIKTSLMRRSKDPMTYNLIVRPRETHPDWIYILGLVDQIRRPTVYLMGWTKELPPINQSGIFAGAHVVPAKCLHCMNDLKGKY